MTFRSSVDVHSSIDTHIGTKVRCAREAQNFTIEYFADALGITFDELFLFESGVERLGPMLLFKAAKILSIDLKVFFNGMQLQGQCGNVRLSLVIEESDVEDAGFLM